MVTDDERRDWNEECFRRCREWEKTHGIQARYVDLGAFWKQLAIDMGGDMRGYRSEDDFGEKVTCPDARCIVATEDAIKVTSSTYNGWIPKALIHYDSEVWNQVGQTGNLVIKAGSWSDEKKLERD